jgi:hypothetical protein
MGISRSLPDRIDERAGDIHPGRRSRLILLLALARLRSHSVDASCLLNEADAASRMFRQ